MGLSVGVSDDGVVRIVVRGRFDFSVHREFRQAYTSNETRSAKRYVIDMAGAEYIDSAALGMLLLLRDHVGADASKIRLMNCSAAVRDVLQVSNFDRLFDIR